MGWPELSILGDANMGMNNAPSYASEWRRIPFSTGRPSRRGAGLMSSAVIVRPDVRRTERPELSILRDANIGMNDVLSYDSEWRCIASLTGRLGSEVNELR
jgi:hypothetical protein